MSEINGTPVFGKKYLKTLQRMPNEAAACAVSDFALRQMQKMGWKEGKGLGKREEGVTCSIRVRKRDESVGIGYGVVSSNTKETQWWSNVYDTIASKVQIDCEEPKKKRKRKKKALKPVDKQPNDKNPEKQKIGWSTLTDEELLAATGGKLFGQRAYGSCLGKLRRVSTISNNKT
uniref:Uncharacterized protein AlNc14C137G7133 n=1 Tax=Albugo laibachii Nc14 TaxID=890382 RepID=F0WKU4_9STRA|nr:conserved hypothetical protein [Albugo laibachii Nc14]|eukprot:CCA21901.1 conserved hypothetical protein [Albugo laibachii Nc14]